MLLGLGLKILLAAAAVGTVAAIVVYVKGSINRSKLQQKAQAQNINKFIIKEIDRCNNVVKFEDMYSDKEVEVRGDDVDWDIDEGDIIYA